MSTVDDHARTPDDQVIELTRLRRENVELRDQVEQMRRTGRALAQIELAHLDDIDRLNARVAELETRKSGD